MILKLGVPNRELTSEVDALRLYNGVGACRLLDADAEKGILLLERLKPGHMLATVMDDERATRIAVEVMKNLWRSSNDLSRYGATAPRSVPGKSLLQNSSNSKTGLTASNAFVNATTGKRAHCLNV